MSGAYDVIVIGGGPAGEHCAGLLAGRGLRVAVVERELVGGECSYWACIPSKALLRAGEAAHSARSAAGTGRVEVDDALAWRDEVVANYSDVGQERWLADHGVKLLRGHGRLAGPGVVKVDGAAFQARHVVIATGSEPIVPDLPGLRELPDVWTNREVTGLKELPRRLLILGGGPVGVEMAQAVRRLGSEVTLVAGGARVLPREPAALGDAIGEVLRREGVEVIVDRMAMAARRDREDYVLELDDRSSVRGDRLLLATGRRPRLDQLGLESVGIKAGARGIPVDARLAATNGVWAIGDVTGVWPLTHIGKYQARIAAANILGDRRLANYDAVPRVVFTDPQAAAVGAMEGRYCAKVPLSEIARTATYARAWREVSGFLTLLSDGQRLTGAYAVGPEAGEWIQQATLAIRSATPLGVLQDTIQPFPTFSEIYLPALEALHGAVRDARLPQPP